MDCSRLGSSLHGDSPGKNAGVGCHALLHGIFPTQGSNPGLLNYRRSLYHLSHQGSPKQRVVLGPTTGLAHPFLWRWGRFCPYALAVAMVATVHLGGGAAGGSGTPRPRSHEIKTLRTANHRGQPITEAPPVLSSYQSVISFLHFCVFSIKASP